MSTLPTPTDAAAEHSNKLRQFIAEDIQRNGVMPFHRYMQLCLYAPGLGYYSAGTTKFGAAGDFVTAPEISPLFAKTLARWLQKNPQPTVVEFGAGSGRLALDILLELQTQQQLPERYCIVEVSADLRQRQQELLQQHLPEFFAQIEWWDQLPEQPLAANVIANEVLDAMPVNVFRVQGTEVQELSVNSEWQVVWQPASAELSKNVAELGIDFADGYTSEINLLLPAWLNSVASFLQQGKVLLVDYGFERAEYYHPQRHMGTLMCHYQHRAHTDPLLYPGLQDITAHVDFTAAINAAQAAGFNIESLQTQAQFLLDNGLTEVMPSMDDEAAYFNACQQVKQLTLPQEMGELFKVLVLTV